MNYKNKILSLVLLFGCFLFQTAQAQIKTCNNFDISIDDVLVSSESGMTIDASGCTYTPGDVIGYLNCIAANNDIPAGDSFVVELEKGDYLNGVSTIDIVIILREMLKIEELDLCNFVSADLNSDNKVNIKDLVLMRWLILGWIAELPDSPSWKFFKSEEINIDGIGPETALKFAKESFPLSTLNLTGFKVGDVNGSVIP